ncbi:hypothetical protein DRY71_01760 [Salmonella enterica subsp. enterica serovar Newport]|uniref:Uncharacterized protein n=1 Tax=Salmonella newport TaxID=108619 RepID=A0A5U9KHC5_SALNE|nr:hypothetical protein [Salmonella enterica subsp. enterica serovar Newport]
MIFKAFNKAKIKIAFLNLFSQGGVVNVFFSSVRMKLINAFDFVIKNSFIGILIPVGWFNKPAPKK